MIESEKRDCLSIKILHDFMSRFEQFDIKYIFYCRNRFAGCG